MADDRLKGRLFSLDLEIVKYEEFVSYYAI